MSNDANPFHSYTAGGPYTVTLVATGPCGTSTSMKNIVISKVTGINQFTPLTVITRYDQYGKNLTVSLSELPSSMGQISVYSLQGKLIASESMNTLSKTIHLGNIAAGSYIVRVQTPNGFGATRIAVTE